MADFEPVKFGTSGLRGPAIGFTSSLVNAYVKAFLDTCCTRAATREVALGIDLRSSSPSIAAEIATAVAGHGWMPVYCGALPTPALAAFALPRSIPAIMVTGSHIPARYNGLKFYRPDGELTKDDEGPLERLATTIYEQNASQSFERDENSLPSVLYEAHDAYIRRYTAAFPEDALGQLRIGVFEHSAVGCDLLVRILEKLGAKVVPFGRSKTFVAIDTEAFESEHLASVRSELRDHELDAVVSTDGDGDRPLVIDEEGNQINGDILGALTARFLGADIVVTPLTSTSALELTGWFGNVHRTRIGSPYVVETMTRTDAGTVVGFEANGGFLTGTDIAIGSSSLRRLPTRDAVLPLVAVLAMARSQNRRLSELRGALPARFMHAGRLQNIPPQQSAGFIEEIAASNEIRQIFDGALSDPVSIDIRDGTRLTLRGGTIVHFRASGNAPELRCYVEADSIQKAEEILRRMTAKLDNHFRNLAAL